MTETAIAMCSAGTAILVMGGRTAKRAVAQARGLDRIAAVGGLCFAIPLAVFGALHLSRPGAVLPIVPAFVPWRLFWVYLVGGASSASSTSSTRRCFRASRS